jgi:hypothetical protein
LSWFGQDFTGRSVRMNEYLDERCVQLGWLTDLDEKTVQS